MGGLLASFLPNGFWSFLILTIVLGGLTAWATGQALAKTWRPVWLLIPYLVMLAAFVQFLHYALFGEELLAIPTYLVSVIILFAAGFLGYRLKRARQMGTQYSFVFETVGGFGWRRKPSAL